MNPGRRQESFNTDFGIVRVFSEPLDRVHV